MNLTSMNGERRMRLTERYMDPPGQSMPDCLIAARHRQPHGAGLPRSRARTPRPTSSRASTGRPRKTPSWTAITRTPAAASSSPTSACAPWAPTASRSRRPAFEDGKIVGTKRLYTDGKFGGKDGKATFFEAQWRGLQAPGKQEEKDKFPFLINNGRTNHVWQNAYLDQENELVVDRWPYPFIEMNPDDMTELGVSEGDLVEVYNDNGSTQAMVYPTRDGEAEGDLHALRLSDGRAGQRRLEGRERVHHPELQADLGQHPEDLEQPGNVAHLSFKSQEYSV